MRFLRMSLIGALALVLTGCLNSTTLVRLKPDGSGTIEQTMLVNMAAAKGLMAMGGGGQVKQSGPVFGEEEFKQAAARMGARPVSLTPVKEGNFEGSKAVFAFDDINKLRLDQDPQVSGGGTGALKNPIRFGLTRQGGSSVLTINVDENVTASAGSRVQESAPAIEQLDPSMMQMIKTMFDGLRVSIDVEVDGKIVKTNADYVSGSRVTLLEVDAAGVFADEARLKSLPSKIRPGITLSELRPHLKEIKGVKINHASISIEYR
jgi:hypothetical protein